MLAERLRAVMSFGELGWLHRLLVQVKTLNFIAASAVLVATLSSGAAAREYFHYQLVS